MRLFWLLLLPPQVEARADLNLGGCLLSSSDGVTIASECSIQETSGCSCTALQQNLTEAQQNLTEANAVIRTLSEQLAALAPVRPVAFFVSSAFDTVQGWTQHQHEQTILPGAPAAQLTNFIPASLNYGKGWRHEEQAFVVPTAGVYAFSARCSGHGGYTDTSVRYIRLAVMLDGVETAAQYTQLVSTERQTSQGYESELQDHISISVPLLAELAPAQVLRLEMESLTSSVLLKSCQFMGHRISDGAATVGAAPSTPPLPAFFASAMQGQLVTADIDAKIVSFTAPSVNLGSGWNDAEQQFMVPVDGIYSVRASCSLHHLGGPPYLATTPGVARYVKVFVRRLPSIPNSETHEMLYTHGTLGETTVTNADYVSLSTDGLSFLSSGDILTLHVHSTSLDLHVSRCLFSVHYVSASAAVAPSVATTVATSMATSSFSVATTKSIVVSEPWGKKRKITGLGNPPNVSRVYSNLPTAAWNVADIGEAHGSDGWSLLNVDQDGGWWPDGQAFHAPTAGAYTLSAVCDFRHATKSTNLISLMLWRGGGPSSDGGTQLVFQRRNLPGRNLCQHTACAADTSGEPHYASVSVSAMAELQAGEAIELYAYAQDISVNVKSCWLSGYRVVEIEPRFVR